MKSIHNYKFGACIGGGGFANVYRATSYLTGQDVAIKMIDKKRILRKKLGERVKKEVEIHSRLKHPRILELYDIFEDDNYVYLVLELAEKGELLQYIKDRGPIAESQARIYLKQIISGVQYLHTHNIIHRDLTLTNTLLTREMNIKIGDFGLATFVKPGVAHSTMCGTPNYISPEVARRSDHGMAVDLWSLGCILYTLLVGHPPFETDTVHGTLDRVIAGDYAIPDHLNPKAADLIRSLLQSDPQKRPTLSEILEHVFMTEDQLNVREKSDDSGRGSTNGGLFETFPGIPRRTSPINNEVKDVFGEGDNDESRPRSSFNPMPTSRSPSTALLPTKSDAMKAPEPIKSSSPLQFSCRKSPIQQVDKGTNSVASSLAAASREESPSTSRSFSNQKSVPLNTSRLRPIRVRLRRAIANLLDDGSLCFEFLCPRMTSVATVVEVFEVSSDGRKISVVRTPKPGWPTSIDLPPLRAASAPGRVTIYEFENLPAKYLKKYQLASDFVQVFRSRTPKVTLLTDRVKCVLMENSHDCVVTMKVGESDDAKVEVTMSQRFCNVATPTLKVSVERPSELSLEAQRWYRDAAAYRERCREIEAVLTRIDPDLNFPAVVGNRHQPTPVPNQINQRNDAIRQSTDDRLKCSELVVDSSSENPNSVIRSQFVPRVGWSQLTRSGHVKVLLNDGSEVLLSPDVPVLRYQQHRGRCETFDLQYQSVPENITDLLMSLPFLPWSLETTMEGLNRLSIE